MRITKLFTCVIAALVMMYGSGCSDQRHAPYQLIPGYGYVPAGAVVDPATGYVTYPQTYSSGTYVVAAPTEPTAVYVAPQAVVRQQPKPRKVKQRRKVRYVRGNARFAKPANGCMLPNEHYYLSADPCGSIVTNVGYTHPEYGTAGILTNSDVVPTVTTAPIGVQPAAPVYTSAAPVQAQYSQVAGDNIRVVYRRGRRAKNVKVVRPTGYVPYAVTTTAAPVYAVPYAVPYTAPISEPYVVPASSYEPTPLTDILPDPVPVAEPAPAPVVEAPAEVKVAQAEPEAPAPQPAEPVFQPVAEPVPQPVQQQPVVQQILIQPVIQPIVQAPIQQYVEPAPIPVPAPVQALPLPPLQVPEPAPYYPPLPQAPIVSEPLSAMISVPGSESGFEPGILNAYCPPDICPVPSPVLCAPGQNLSECFTMNDYQLLNTPVEVMRPDPSAPLSFANSPSSNVTVIRTAPVMVPVQAPAAAPVQLPVPVQPDTSKYQALTPSPQSFGGAQQAQIAAPRPEARRPEVTMPTPIGNTAPMPQVPPTSEIESALDAMLATPILK